MPQHPRRERIVGTFHTVEDLINLPPEAPVDPRKANEISRDMPVKLWMGKEELIELLALNIEVLKANQSECSPEEARQVEVLVAQRQLWIDWLSQSEADESYVGLFPASTAGDEYDDEAAIVLEDDPGAG